MARICSQGGGTGSNPVWITPRNDPSHRAQPIVADAVLLYPRALFSIASEGLCHVSRRATTIPASQPGARPSGGG